LHHSDEISCKKFLARRNLNDLSNGYKREKILVSQKPYFHWIARRISAASVDLAAPTLEIASLYPMGKN